MYDLFLDHLELFRSNYNLSLLGFVVMPNHVHLVIFPHQIIDMGRAIGRLKSGYAFEILSKWKQTETSRLNRLEVLRGGKKSHVFWHLRCYDHNCRSTESVKEKIHYCHMNPVKSGLVASPEEWRWSSYDWYHGNQSGMVQIDKIDDLL